MSIRNELLKNIVIASGGTVTGGTINELLQDWLDALSQ